MFLNRFLAIFALFYLLKNSFSSVCLTKSLNKAYRSSASLWIFDLEFVLKYFWSSHTHHKQDLHSKFCYLKKAKNGRWLIDKVLLETQIIYAQ
jgi:hypothetical protein